MSLFLTIVGSVVALNALVVTIAALRAPHGYEDESGFHLGDADKLSEIGVIHADCDAHREAA